MFVNAASYGTGRFRDGRRAVCFVDVQCDRVLREFVRNSRGIPSAEALRRVQAIEAECARNPKVFSKLIDLFHDKYGVEEAEEVWRWLVQVGEVEPNLNHFNVKMRLYSQGLEADKMIGLKNRMEENGIRLDVVSYSMLIHVLGKCGQLEEAEGLVSEMQRKGIKPNVVTFNSLLSSLSEHNDMARFRHWKSVMRKLRIPENALTASILVDSYVRLGQLIQAENLISDMIRQKKRVRSALKRDWTFRGERGYVVFQVHQHTVLGNSIIGSARA